MTEIFNHALVELGGIPVARLSDPHALASVMVAAAGAIGLSTGSPPAVHESGSGAALGLLCADGHVVLHTVPAAGVCLVDIVARSPITAAKGVDVIARRLGATQVPTPQR